MGRRTALFVRRELAASLRARWFLVYAAAFLVGGLLLAGFGLQDSVVLGYRGFAKTMAGLVHLALLFVPLMALFPAAAAIAEDRESGTLEYVLAQPVTFAEVFTGKWLGVALAVLLALALGLGAAGGLAVARGVPPLLVATLFGFVVLLALAFIAIGLLLSTWAGSRSRATTFGLVTWLVFVALGTLGVMAAFVRWGLPQGVLVAWSFVNPVEAFRLGVVTALDPDLSLLGPVGVKIIQTLGPGGTMAASAASLLTWIGVPYWAGRRLFSSERSASAL